MRGHRTLLRAFLPVSLAFSITVLSAPLTALAAPGDVNSTNSGAVVQPGTYFNTSGSSTSFINPGGGLHVRAGDLVRGVESSAAGVPTGNGGTMYFRAPGNVIRIDGTVDVSALRNGSSYLGNGGKVFFDSAYLFQNGNVFANGFNGGLVQFNVGGMTVGPNARITAQGFGGLGGNVNINSPGSVDVRAGAIVDTSGQVIGTFDSNVINIEGGVVNNEGILRANGLATTDFKANSDSSVISLNPDVVNNPAPGPITGGNGTGAVMDGIGADHTPPSPTTSRGGLVRLISTGQTYTTTDAINGADTAIISASEKTALNTRNNGLISTNNGDVVNTGTVEANGGLEQNGGTVLIGSARDINNTGFIRANGANARDGVFDLSGNGFDGGNGGTLSLNAMRTINNRGTFDASGGRGGRANSVNATAGSGRDAVATVNTVAGQGGDGGLIALSYLTFDNRATVRANGGQGGTGGTANTFDQEFGNAGNPTPTSRAISTGGQGGQGGDGGLIVLSGNFNAGGGAILRADGGQGGRGGNATAGAEAFSNFGTPNPQATATAGAGGQGGAAGTVVVPSPSTLSQSQNFTAKNGGVGDSGSTSIRNTRIQNGVITSTTGGSASTPGSVTTGNNNPLLETRRNELLVHQENAILLSQRGGVGANIQDLSLRLSGATIRSVAQPGGITSTTGLDAAKHATNFVVSSTTAGNALHNDFTNGNATPIFTRLHTLTMINNGDIDNDMHWAPGLAQVGPGFHDLTLAVGGGKLNYLSNGSIVNDGFLITRGLWTGGSISLAATQNVTNNNVVLNTAFNKHLATGYTRTPGYLSSHSGSVIFKALMNIANNDKLNSSLGFFEIHSALDTNPRPEWPKFMNAGFVGSSVYLLAGGNITNANGAVIAADALTYRDTTVDAGASNPANAFGGIVNLKAGGNVVNNGTITVDGTSWQGSTGNFRFTTTSGLTEVNSRDGDIIEE